MIKRMLIRISVFALAALVGMMVVPVRWDCGGIVHGTLFDGRGGFTYTSCTSSEVTIRFNPERNRNYASVFWVDERIVSFVDSTSLKYALQHEGVLDR